MLKFGLTKYKKLEDKGETTMTTKNLNLDYNQNEEKSSLLINNSRKTYKTRIYKCIKRILKKNMNQSASMSASAVSCDYKEIKSLLEKDPKKYGSNTDVDCSKILIRKFAQNLLKSTEDNLPLVYNNEKTSKTDVIKPNDDIIKESWFQADIPREKSLKKLAKMNEGEFIVRKSSSKPNCFALSLRVPSGIAHYLILSTLNGYKIKGSKKEFHSIRALVTHHSVMQEILPLPLSIPRPQNFCTKLKHSDDYDSCTDIDINGNCNLFQDLNL